MAIYEIARVDLADEVLLKYLVDVLVLVDGKNIPAEQRLKVSVLSQASCWVAPLGHAPVRLHTAANSTQDHIAAWMIWNPVCDIVDTISAVDPVPLSFSVVAVDLIQSEQSVLGLLVVVLWWRFSESIAAEL